MAKRTCNVCGEEKDSIKGFYKTSGATCCVCKSKLANKKAKEKSELELTVLMEIRDNQRELMQRMEQMELQVSKVCKALKKLSTA